MPNSSNLRLFGQIAESELTSIVHLPPNQCHTPQETLYVAPCVRPHDKIIPVADETRRVLCVSAF